jgi:hypothetical protein
MGNNGAGAAKPGKPKRKTKAVGRKRAARGGASRRVAKGRKRR